MKKSLKITLWIVGRLVGLIALFLLSICFFSGNTPEGGTKIAKKGWYKSVEYHKTICEMLPAGTFLKPNRPYIVNKECIDSFNNNDVFIDKYEMAISNAFRDSLFEILHFRFLKKLI